IAFEILLETISQTVGKNLNPEDRISYRIGFVNHHRTNIIKTGSRVAKGECKYESPQAKQSSKQRIHSTSRFLLVCSEKFVSDKPSKSYHKNASGQQD